MSGHSAILHPKIEKSVSPDDALVSITMHGIAACRELVLTGNASSPAQMSFSRVCNPTDLLDKTIVLKMPLVNTYTIDDPCGNPATVTMLAERLGVGSQHMTLRSNGVSDAVTHCNLTLNNGTVTTQPSISDAARAFYKSAEDVNGNNGVGMRDRSVSPYLSCVSGTATHNNGVRDTMLPVHMHQRKVTDITFASEIVYEDNGGSTVFVRGYDGQDLAQENIKANLIEYFNSGDAARGKQYAKGDVNYWPTNIRRQSKGQASGTVQNGILTPNNAPYTWLDGLKIATIVVEDTVYATVPHDLLDDENTDECLSNVRFFDLKVSIPDASKMFNLSRDFTIPWEPFIDQSATYSTAGTDAQQAVLAGNGTPVVPRIAYHSGTGAGKLATVNNAFGSARPFGRVTNGMRITPGHLTPIITNPVVEGQTTLYAREAPVVTDQAAGEIMAISAPTIQSAAEYGADDVLTSLSAPGWDGYYAKHDPRAMIKSVATTFTTTKQPELQLRLYQSAVPVPRALSFGITTDIIRSRTQKFDTLTDLTKTISPISVITDSFSLSEVPQAIYVYAMLENPKGDTAGARMSTPPQLANISNISFRTTANTGTLSTATSRQLYQMCQRNGLNQDFSSFEGDGNVIKIKPSKDLGGWVEGARETFTHDFQVTVNVPCQDKALNARMLDSANTHFHNTAQEIQYGTTDTDLGSAGGLNLTHVNPGTCINYCPPNLHRGGFSGTVKQEVPKYVTFNGESSGAQGIFHLDGSTNAPTELVARTAFLKSSQQLMVGKMSGATPLETVSTAEALSSLAMEELGVKIYDKLVTAPEAMARFSKYQFNGATIKLFTVYEMVGTCHLQADGLMQTTSGFDTSTIVNTLQSEGLTHTADAGVAPHRGGGVAAIGAGVGTHHGSGLFSTAKKKAKQALKDKFNEHKDAAIEHAKKRAREEVEKKFKGVLGRS